MTHYKIESITFCGINKCGITQDIKYIPYIKCWYGWKRLTKFILDTDNFGHIHKLNVDFETLENAENFIHEYHKNRKNLGKYTITTIKKIVLE